MPFEFTPDYFGTRSDCYKDECVDSKSGFFVKTLSKEFSWVQNNAFNEDLPQYTLSSAMAASSGVLAGTIGLSYEYELIRNLDETILGNMRGQHIAEIRKEIALSDGGQSENLGLVPLIERGVDLIIISYMGKDNDLTKNPWEDLDYAEKQVKNLLGCTVVKPNIT